MTRGTWILVLLGLGRPLHAQSPAPAPAPSPPAACDTLRWNRDCSTPGVQLTLTENFRQKTRDDVVVGYEPRASGLPAGKVYSIRVTPITGAPYTVMTGFIADSSGGAICGDSTAAQSPARVPAMLGWCKQALRDLILSVGQFTRGEPYRVALISTDGSVRAYTEAIPHPLVARTNRCTITATMSGKDVFTFSGTGFQPGEPLRVTMRSGREETARSAQADSAGQLGDMTVTPVVTGQRGGEASYEARGAKCRVTLKYAWGNKALAAR